MVLGTVLGRIWEDLGVVLGMVLGTDLGGSGGRPGTDLGGSGETLGKAQNRQNPGLGLWNREILGNPGLGLWNRELLGNPGLGLWNRRNPGFGVPLEMLLRVWNRVRNREISKSRGPAGEAFFPEFSGAGSGSGEKSALSGTGETRKKPKMVKLRPENAPKNMKSGIWTFFSFPGGAGPREGSFRSRPWPGISQLFAI